MPVILATWEAEIDWSQFKASTDKKKFSRPHLKRKKLGMVACACHSSDSWKCKIGGSWVQAGLGEKWDCISKITTAKRVWGVAQDHLPSKHEALSSNLSTSGGGHTTLWVAVMKAIHKNQGSQQNAIVPVLRKWWVGDWVVLYNQKHVQMTVLKRSLQKLRS
jgi:hypothetical protein